MSGIAGAEKPSAVDAGGTRCLSCIRRDELFEWSLCICTVRACTDRTLPLDHADGDATCGHAQLHGRKPGQAARIDLSPNAASADRRPSTLFRHGHRFFTATQDGLVLDNADASTARLLPVLDAATFTQCVAFLRQVSNASGVSRSKCAAAVGIHTEHPFTKLGALQLPAEGDCPGALFLTAAVLGDAGRSHSKHVSSQRFMAE